MSSSANRIDGRDVFRKENRFEKSREKLGGRPARALVLPLAAAVFVVESIVVALTYSLGWRNGFALQLNTDPSGTFWPLLALAAASAALAIIVLADVAARLRIGLVARWDAEDRYPHAEPPRAFGRPRTGWGDVGLAMGAILFFSEAITVTVALASSYGSGFSLLVAFNAYGEFWVEFPLVVAALPLAVLALRLSLAPVRQAMRTAPMSAAFRPSPACNTGCLPLRLAPYRPGSGSLARLQKAVPAHPLACASHSSTRRSPGGPGWGGNVGATEPARHFTIQDWVTRVTPRLYHCSNTCGLHDSPKASWDGKGYRSHRCLLPFDHPGPCLFIASCGKG